MRDPGDMRHSEHGSDDVPMPDRLWTCPMHPEVRENGPGTCPICGMPLEPAKQPGIPDILRA
jgi:Cu+-exporting ATPase